MRRFDWWFSAIVTALFITLPVTGCSSAPAPVEEKEESTALEAPVSEADRCDGGDAEACMDLAESLVMSDAVEEAVELYMQSCELGAADGCVIVGDAHFMGIPDETVETKERGLEAFAEACRLDADSEGCVALAHHRARGAQELRDVEAGLEVLRDGCERDGGRTCRSLGRYYYEGQAVDKDRERAHRYSERGCVLKDPEACVDAGNRYRYGEGVEADAHRALEFYEEACRLESYRGCLNLERFSEMVACERQANLDCPERIDEPAPVECPEGEEDMFSPMSLPLDQWEGRRGARILELRELNTSKEEPIETCQTIAYDWVANLRCNSGRPALGGHRMAAASARQGSVGGGGRCDYVIDLYELSCPEEDYEVYVDWYFCPQE